MTIHVEQKVDLEQARRESPAVQLLEKAGYSLEALSPPERDRVSMQTFHINATKQFEIPGGEREVNVLVSPSPRGFAGARFTVEGLGLSICNNDFNLTEMSGNLILAELVATQGVPAERVQPDQNPDIVLRIEAATKEIRAKFST